MRDQTIENSYRMFRNATREHELTIKHDDGLYRHLHCAKPGTGIWSFDIVTWPGHLSIGGDIDSYVFARTPDMFEFFAGSGDGPHGINPHYWGEKVVTRARRPEREYSPDAFKTAVVTDFMQCRDAYPGESAEIFRAIRDFVLDSDYIDQAEHARAAVDRFEHRTRSGKTFDFGDWIEWNITDWSPHFLRACHAIVWGIRGYRKVKAGTKVEAVAANA